MADVPDKSKPDGESPRRKVPDRRVVDRLIQDAIARGDFDNLPGKGRPLKLDDNPYAGDEALAHKLLRDNDITLPWIAERAQLQAQIEALRADIQIVWQRFEPELFQRRGVDWLAPLQASWRGQLATWETAVADLNRKITSLNLKLPVQRLELFRLTLDAELARAGARRNLRDD